MSGSPWIERFYVFKFNFKIKYDFSRIIRVLFLLDWNLSTNCLIGSRRLRLAGKKAVGWVNHNDRAKVLLKFLFFSDLLFVGYSEWTLLQNVFKRKFQIVVQEHERNIQVGWWASCKLVPVASFFWSCLVRWLFGNCRSFSCYKNFRWMQMSVQ